MLAYVLSFLFKVFMLLNIVSEKLLIHEFNYAVFFLCLLAMPSFIYAIKVSFVQKIFFLTVLISQIVDPLAVYSLLGGHDDKT